MKKSNYKILVLTDLGALTNTVLKSAVSLAQKIGGEIEVFSVKKPTDIIERENQLSSMRTINDQHLKMESKMKRMIDPIIKDYGIDIRHSFTFGNVKSELENYIKQSQPAIIVLGKKKPNSFKLIGDGVTQFVLNTFDGVIMIAAKKNPLEPNEQFSLGLLNNSESWQDIEFADVLLEQSKKPVKSFKTVQNVKASKQPKVSEDIKTIDFVFQQNDNAITSISSYLTKSKVNLVCLKRDKKDSKNKSNQGLSNVNSIINTLNVSLLMGSR